VSISTLEVQCLLFQQDNKKRFAAAKFQKTFFPHEYAISSDGFISLAPFVVFLIVLLYHLLIILTLGDVSNSGRRSLI
jgi:hypothetical protein